MWRALQPRSDQGCHRARANQGQALRVAAKTRPALTGPARGGCGIGGRDGRMLAARDRGRYRDHRQGIFDRVLDEASPARMKGCWRQRRPSSPRAGARPFGLRGLTPVSASNQGSPCDRRLDVAQQPIAIAGSNGLPVFRTPKHSTNSLRIAATTICLGLRRPRDFNRATSATIAGLCCMADMAGM
jgi:hypothetical protein